MIRAKGIGMRQSAVCMFYLAILAVCGFVGASKQQHVPAVSAAIVRSSENWSMQTKDSSADAETRLQEERRQEIELLQAVIEHGASDASTKNDALAQMTALVCRMECEASASACLEEMGFTGAAVSCSSDMLTLLIPYAQLQREEDSMRVIDAMSSITEYEPANIKIILTKK